MLLLLDPVEHFINRSWYLDKNLLITLLNAFWITIETCIYIETRISWE